jgi:predicted  nucleic acid-binding Zn-ribbon protein
VTNRTVLVLLRASADQFNREMRSAKSAVSDLRNEIDTTNDRTAWLVQGFLALGPALAPIGASAVPILAGIAAQATVGVAAIGTMALAFNGVGDALKALNNYQLEPTLDNFRKMQEAMQQLGPDGAEFVVFLDRVGEQLSVLGRDARAGMFPGLQAGIEADAAEALAGGEFSAFFEYMENEARPILQDMGRTAGNFIDGFAHMLVAFAPATEDFSNGLLDMSRSFEAWSEGLGDNESFQDFLLYIEQSGPMVLDLLGSFVNAFVQLAEAAAPVGDALVPALTALLDIIAALANTPLGSLLILGGALAGIAGRLSALKTVATGGALGAMTKGFQQSAGAITKAVPPLRDWTAALGSAARSTKQLEKNMASGGQLYHAASRRALEGRDAVKAYARETAAATGSAVLFGLAVSGVSEKMGVTNTTMGGMVGLMATGGPWGFAIGAGIGALMDFGAAAEDTATQLQAVDAALASGDTKQLEDQLARLEDHYDTLGGTTEQIQRALGNTLGTLTGGFLGDSASESVDKYNAELEATERAISSIKRALNPETFTAFETKTSRNALMDLVLGGLAPASREARALSRALDDLVEGFTRLEGILGRQEAFDNYQAAIDNVRKGVKDLGDTYDATTQKGRQNRANIREFIDGIMEVATGLEDAGRIAERNDFLKGARQQFLDFAKVIDIPRGMVERLADEIWNVDQQEANPRVRVKGGKQAEDDLAGVLSFAAQVDAAQPDVPVTVKPGDSLNILARIKAAIAAIKDKSVSITTVYRTEHEKALGNPHLPDPIPGSSGMTVPGPRLPYRDKVFAWLAPGEEVITNRHGEADRFRADRDSGRIPRYADGGTVLSTRGGDGAVEAMTREAAVALKMLANAARDAGVSFDSAVGGGYGGGPLGRLRRQLDAVTERLKKANAELNRMEKALKRQEKAISKQEQVVAEAFQAIEDVLSQMQAMRDSIADKLTKGLFEGAEENSGMNLFSLVMGNLTGNTNAGNAWMQNLSALQGLGLDGPALQALLEQATGDQLAQFAQLTPEQIAQFEEMFNAAATATGGAGALSAQLVFSEQLQFARTQWGEEKEVLKEAKEQRREMTDAIKDQTKVVEKLEKTQERIKDRIDKIEESHPRRNGQAFQSALNGKAGDMGRSKS